MALVQALTDVDGQARLSEQSVAGPKRAGCVQSRALLASPRPTPSPRWAEGSSAAPPAMGSLRQRGVPSVDGVGSSPSGEESHAGGANGNTAPRRSLEGRWDGDGERPTGCPARPVLAAQPTRTSPGQQLSRPAVCPTLRGTDCQRQCSRVALVSNRARPRRARGLSVSKGSQRA